RTLRPRRPPTHFEQRRFIPQRNTFYLHIPRNPLQILFGQRCDRCFLRLPDPRNLDLHGQSTLTSSPRPVLPKLRTRCSRHPNTSAPPHAPRHGSQAISRAARAPATDETAPRRPEPVPKLLQPV